MASGHHIRADVLFQIEDDMIIFRAEAGSPQLFPLHMLVHAGQDELDLSVREGLRMLAPVVMVGDVGHVSGAAQFGIRAFLLPGRDIEEHMRRGDDRGSAEIVDQRAIAACLVAEAEIPVAVRRAQDHALLVGEPAFRLQPQVEQDFAVVAVIEDRGMDAERRQQPGQKQGEDTAETTQRRHRPPLSRMSA